MCQIYYDDDDHVDGGIRLSGFILAGFMISKNAELTMDGLSMSQ